LFGTLERVSTTSFEIECPHCHKTFSAETIEGSAARYRGFKCTHCRLFVPYERAAEQDLLEPHESAE
jgi:transposase-like protein